MLIYHSGMMGDKIELAKQKEIKAKVRHEKDERIRLKLIFLNASANFSMDLKSDVPRVG